MRSRMSLLHRTLTTGSNESAKEPTTTQLCSPILRLLCISKRKGRKKKKKFLNGSVQKTEAISCLNAATTLPIPVKCFSIRKSTCVGLVKVLQHLSVLVNVLSFLTALISCSRRWEVPSRVRSSPLIQF